jgi:hypothetical protein
LQKQGGSYAFSKRLLQQLVLHAEFLKHPLQPAVLIFHDLHVSNHRRIHAAVLRLLLVKRGVANPVSPAKIGNGQPAFNLAQNAHDLRLAKSHLPHQHLLVVLSDKI